jgi:hypothetical protein
MAAQSARHERLEAASAAFACEMNPEESLGRASRL